MSFPAPVSACLGPAQQVFPWVLVPGCLPERLERVALLVVQVPRHLNVHGDQEVTHGAVWAADALAPDPEGAPVGSPGRDPDIDRHRAMIRHPDLRAECSRRIGT